MIKYQTENCKIYCDDNVLLMSELDSNIIDLTVTSPPYDNIRDYHGFNFDFENVSKQLYRITKDGGVVVWVVNDATINGSETGTSFRQALGFMDVGFKLHDTMIYEKPGTVYPASYKSNRYSSIFEYMFVFSKGKITTANLIKDRHNTCFRVGFGVNTERLKDGNMKNRGKRLEVRDEFSYRNNIWRMNTSSQENPCKSIKNPATFPEQMANYHILTWSNEGDLVLDPFLGSGTTGKMAIMNNRNFIGVDCSEEYVDLSIDRITNTRIINALPI